MKWLSERKSDDKVFVGAYQTEHTGRVEVNVGNGYEDVTITLEQAEKLAAMLQEVLEEVRATEE